MFICDRCARDGMLVKAGPSVDLKMLDNSRLQYSETFSVPAFPTVVVNVGLSLCQPCCNSLAEKVKAVAAEFASPKVEEGK
jgi:hypothetical protein